MRDTEREEGACYPHYQQTEARNIKQYEILAKRLEFRDCKEETKPDITKGVETKLTRDGIRCNVSNKVQNRRKDKTKDERVWLFYKKKT